MEIPCKWSFYRKIIRKPWIYLASHVWVAENQLGDLDQPQHKPTLACTVRSWHCNAGKRITVCETFALISRNPLIVIDLMLWGRITRSIQEGNGSVWQTLVKDRSANGDINDATRGARSCLRRFWSVIYPDGLVGGLEHFLFSHILGC